MSNRVARWTVSSRVRGEVGSHLTVPTKNVQSLFVRRHGARRSCRYHSRMTKSSLIFSQLKSRPVYCFRICNQRCYIMYWTRTASKAIKPAFSPSAKFRPHVRLEWRAEKHSIRKLPFNKPGSSPRSFARALVHHPSTTNQAVPRPIHTTIAGLYRLY